MKITEFLHLRGYALDFIRHELGAVICWEPVERARALELLRDVGRVFRREMLEARAPVVLLYLFRQDEQTAPEFCRAGKCFVDGFSSVRVNAKSGAAYSVIGLAVEALRCNDAADYVPLLFLHELAHILGPATEGKHNAAFHAFLDDLIERYNQATGSEIVNDYCA